MSNHDKHYRNLERDGLIEPIVRMESTICLGLPVEYHAIARRNLNLALADKHIGRVGTKAGEVEDKELNKAGNYLHRARTGSWRPVSVDLPLFAPPRNPWCSGCVNENDATEHCLACRSNGYNLRSEHSREPLVTVTTHGKTAEATEADVGKAVAELQAAPTPNNPVQPRLKDCLKCAHNKPYSGCAKRDCRNYCYGEPKAGNDCLSCAHVGKDNANGPWCSRLGCSEPNYSRWEPKPTVSVLVPDCDACRFGPRHATSHCARTACKGVSGKPSK